MLYDSTYVKQAYSQRQIRAYQGLGGEEGGVIASWIYFLFGVVKTVLEVDSGDGCTTL